MLRTSFISNFNGRNRVLMKKKVVRNTEKVISFLLVFVLLFISLDSILKFKYSESILPIKTFYEQDEDTVDVLVIGSSHSYTNFRPDVLWNNYGYSSYILGASIQPLWNSYYYLEEALKTQSPKVIILEGYRLVEQKEYTTVYYAIKSTYGMKWSETKIDAMKASFEEDELKNYIFEFTNYHSRYSDVGKGDFVSYSNNEWYKYYKGELSKLDVYELTEPKVSEYSTKEKKLAEKTEEYYIKMIELAKSYNIPLVTVVAPYNMPQGEYGYYKYAEKIAESYGMPFINTNELYDELNIDFSADFCDEYGHLNNLGAEKLSDYVGKYISEHYNVEDHRNDEKYESWDISSYHYKRYYNNPIKQETNLLNYIERCETEGDYSYIFIINGYDIYSDSMTEEFNSVFEKFNISSESITDGVWVIRNSQLEYQSSSEKLDKNIRMDSDNDIKLKYGAKNFTISTFDGDVFYACINNNKTVRTIPIGITMIVYDDIYDRGVETVYYSPDENELTRENTLLPEEK